MVKLKFEMFFLDILGVENKRLKTQAFFFTKIEHFLLKYSVLIYIVLTRA